MLTKNFYAMIGTMIGKGIYADGYEFNGKDTLGNVTKLGFPELPTLFISAMRKRSEGDSFGVVFSKDKTAPAPLDYAPKSPIGSGVLSSQIPQDISRNITDESLTFSITYGLKNLSGAPVVINSVFLNSEAKSRSFTVDHTLLEKPITLQPGESKQITYTIRFNYPTAPTV